MWCIYFGFYCFILLLERCVLLPFTYSVLKSTSLHQFISDVKSNHNDKHINMLLNKCKYKSHNNTNNNVSNTKKKYNLVILWPYKDIFIICNQILKQRIKGEFGGFRLMQVKINKVWTLYQPHYYFAAIGLKALFINCIRMLEAS